MSHRNRVFRKQQQKISAVKKYSRPAMKLITDLGLMDKMDLFEGMPYDKINIKHVEHKVTQFFGIEEPALRYCAIYRINLPEVRETMVKLWDETGEDPKENITLASVKAYHDNTTSTGDEEE